MNDLLQSSLKISVTLTPDASLPTYQTEGAAGMDLRISEDIQLKPLERKILPTGIRVAIPPGYEGQVRPRSGMAIKHGITMLNSPGTIDSDYRGEIGLIAINLGSEDVSFKKGERMAQLVICPVVRAELAITDSLEDTQRGEGGFGSTGSG